MHFTLSFYIMHFLSWYEALSQKQLKQQIIEYYCRYGVKNFFPTLEVWNFGVFLNLLFSIGNWHHDQQAALKA